MTKKNHFSTKLDLKLADKLKADLISQGFELTQPAYTLFSAKKQGVVCTLYQSGSLIVQGKEMGPFIEFYLEPEILLDFRYTHPIAHTDLTPRIGVDEAGKGDFFGPLCIAGLYANEEEIKKLISLGIQDSKKVSDQTILKVGKELKNSFTCSVIRLFPLKYNELYSNFGNLNQMLGWGHATVIADLVEKTGCKKAFIDQFAGEWVVEKALKKKDVLVDLHQEHKGEEDVVVAAASIVARYSFLKGMDTLSEETGFTLPKGASSLVLKAGKKLVQELGAAKLPHFSKSHFKTTGEILGDLIS